MSWDTFRNSGCNPLPAQLDTLLDLNKETRRLNLQVFMGAGKDVFYTRSFLRRGGPDGGAFVPEFIAVYTGHIGEFFDRDVIYFHTPRGMVTGVRGCRGIL